MPAVMEDFEAFGQLRERPRADIPTRPKERTADRPRRSHWLRNLVLLVLAYVVLATGTMLQPVAVPFTSLRLALPFPFGATLVFGLPDRPFTVMVVGLDRRPGQDGPSRTDTILLVRIDPKSHDAAFLSIPRDTLMEVPLPGGGFDDDRINTAYVYNWSSEDSGAAPRALMQTVEHNLGIGVDHYVIFDQRSAEGLIDAMGGVTIDNPVEFGQDDYSDDDINVIPQYFPEGKLKLDGYQAVAYGRIREGSSDFDRIERQQRVAAALIDKASSPFSVFRIPSLYGAFKDTITTDMSARQSAGVLALLKRVPDSKLRTKSLADAAVPCNTCKASIQLLDPALTAQIINEAFGGDTAGQVAADRLAAAGVTP